MSEKGEYKGYVYPTQNDPRRHQLLTAPGVTADLPAGTFVALGDNSAIV